MTHSSNCNKVLLEDVVFQMSLFYHDSYCQDPLGDRTRDSGVAGGDFTPQLPERRLRCRDTTRIRQYVTEAKFKSLPWELNPGLPRTRQELYHTTTKTDEIYSQKVSSKFFTWQLGKSYKAQRTQSFFFKNIYIPTKEAVPKNPSKENEAQKEHRTEEDQSKRVKHSRSKRGKAKQSEKTQKGQKQIHQVHFRLSNSPEGQSPKKSRKGGLVKGRQRLTDSRSEEDNTKTKCKTGEQREFIKGTKCNTGG